MKVYIGADYRGFEKKRDLVRAFTEAGVEMVDLGTFEAGREDDYNDPAIAVAQSILKDARDGAAKSFGVLICDSAHGMTMQANRFRGIRAAHCDSSESAVLAREHDDANVVCLSAHFLTAMEMVVIVNAFLNTKFEPLERRVRRVKKLDADPGGAGEINENLDGGGKND